MTTASERIPCFDCNAKRLNMGDYIQILIIGVYFVLNQNRLDVNLFDEIVNFLNIVA